MSVRSFLENEGPFKSILEVPGSKAHSVAHTSEGEWKIQGPVSGFYQIRPPQHFDPCEIRFDLRW